MTAAAIFATYLIETCLPIEQAAEMIAGEQSSGTFLPIPGETEELKQRSRAKVLSIRMLDSVATPSLPGGRNGSQNAGASNYQRAEIRLSFPYDNIGPNVPTLLATVCGNLFELAEHSGCKLLDIDLPDVFGERYPGPQFGIQGTRKLAGVFDRPILGTIVKPSVGLTPGQTAALVRELGEAGIDFIKDDELMANPPHSPLRERVDAVMYEIHRLADKLGRKIMYAVNISDEVEAMREHHDYVLQAGGSCVMVSLNHVGWAGVSALRKFSQLPIHGHRNGWGMLNRHPLLGMAFSAYQKLWRILGVDHLHVNGFQNKFWEPDESVAQSIAAMNVPVMSGYFAMPVISSGQWGGQAAKTLQFVGSQDLIYVAGGGIVAHPSGPAAGLRGIQQAWEAAAAGISLEEYALSHTELKETIAKYGGRK
ncbi:MAG: ribulose-bisphosphate carboxylase large subunit family protein [Planctomycetales bacterium]|nr:ribulose-bisphosphate carboxylase large subunit family protein [Planctomycetales bacterium]